MQLLQRILTSAALVMGLSLPYAAVAQTPAPKTAATKAVKTPAPTASQIADAKSKGLVWCNKNTKVYHLADSKYYGTTTNGKFLTVDEAKKEGYKQAHDTPIKTK